MQDVLEYPNMEILTDSLAYAETLFPQVSDWKSINRGEIQGKPAILTDRLFNTDSLFQAISDIHDGWKYLFAVESAPCSQYDIVGELCRENKSIPDSFICAAGYGKGFHGFKGRQWASLPGNIHITAYMTPNVELPYAGVGFTVLAVKSVVETIDTVPELKGRSSIKWVNDILIKKAKVSGALANIQCCGKLITGASVGIGLNIETTPIIGGDSFVPEAAALKDFVADNSDCTQGILFGRLIDIIDRNYRLYVTGNYSELVGFYRSRSALIGRDIIVQSDTSGDKSTELARGKLLQIGDNLELFIDGRPDPITSGRVILQNWIDT
jgi:biotin-(acetyl-CoA carboxylase) ligase